MIDAERLEWGREMLLRQVAHCVHFAMWNRGVTFDELEARLDGRVSTQRLRGVLMGESRQATISDLADIMFCLDMVVRIDLQALQQETSNEGQQPTDTEHRDGDVRDPGVPGQAVDERAGGATPAGD